MKVILAAGGSGGHIFPSVALAEELNKMGVQDISFVSSKRRLDRSLLAGSKFPCYFLSVNPMPYKSDPVKLIKFVWKIVMDSFAAIFILAKIRPNIVVGFGGYSSGTIVAVARIFNIPAIIHEQNHDPGRANKILSRLVNRIAVSFEGSKECFPGAEDKILFTGNPLRLDMLSNERDVSVERLGLDPGKKIMLIMGGSQGSAFLNKTVSEASVLINRDIDVQFIHLTGERDYSGVKEFYDEKNIPAKVFSFLERIDDAYAASDFVISRAGAAAVFELAFYGKPMMLIPYPNPKNNQRSNAVYFAKNSAAIYREEKELSAETIAEEVKAVFIDQEKMEQISKAARRLGCPEAGKCLASEVVRLGGKNKR